MAYLSHADYSNVLCQRDSGDHVIHMHTSKLGGWECCLIISNFVL